MKNHILFFIGIALLILTVWATTMIGIKLNDDKAPARFGIFAERNLDICKEKLAQYEETQTE